MVLISTFNTGSIIKTKDSFNSPFLFKTAKNITKKIEIVLKINMFSIVLKSLISLGIIFNTSKNIRGKNMYSARR